MKKYDPRMHSAEHILNQTMDRMYQCGRCFNAHIERKKSIGKLKITSTAFDDGILRIRYKLEN
jgi:Ser-tRNA(Ala) deacylase AlaX